MAIDPNRNSSSVPLNDSQCRSLLENARHAAKQAYAPYSNFPVGAAILTSENAVIEGCNVENASFGLCICAERTAATRAVVQNQRQWVAVAVVSKTSVSPCGACRQFLAEFGTKIEVIIGNLDPSQSYRRTTLGELLPDAMEFSTS